MNLEIHDYPFGERPQNQVPDKAFYELLGEEGIRKLVSDHYELLRTSKIAGLFPEPEDEFEAAMEHSADFFVQICGGPQYFTKNRGNPMLARRHAPFRITPQARKVWLSCYQQLLPELDLPEDAILSFWNYIEKFSNWMVNTPDIILDTSIQFKK